MPIPAPSVGSPAAVLGALRTFKYEAQSIDGKRITGVIDAQDPEWVSRQLSLLRLRLVRLDLVEPPDAALASGAAPVAPEKDRPIRGGRALRGDDFLAFNQQLAYLARAGLPIESGLRLIAKDIRSGRLAQTIKSVADELDRGVPIGEAFDKHRGRFPSLYGRLLDAGVASGDLAGVLLGFGAHLEMLQRLRSALWRTLSYPVTVLAALALVVLFLGRYVIPRFADLYEGIANTPVYDRFTGSWSRAGFLLPLPTRILLGASQAVPYVAGLILAGILLGPIVWRSLRRGGWDRHVIDAIARRVPLIGRPIRLNLIARWCDALRIGVTARLPLPEAIDMAGDAVRSPSLSRNGRVLIDRLEKGQPLSAQSTAGRTSAGGASCDLALLPATVPVAIELASGHNDLPAALGSLTELYERQAESHVNGIPAVLTPVMVIVVATAIGFVILALLLPMIAMLDALMRLM